jgi:phosphatidylglycerophosphate synthase
MSTTQTRARTRLSPTRRHLIRLRRNLSTLPNQLTAFRLLMVPVLWAVALTGHARWVGVGVGVAAATDWFDGYLSRRWNQTSAFGSRLDSVADHALAISTALWMALLRPHFFREQKWPMIAWAAFALFVLAVSWLRFHRFVDLHLYTSKLAVTLSFCFAVPLLVLGDYHPLHFYLTWGVCLLAALEALIVILTRDHVDEHIGSILLPRRRGPLH